MHGTVRQTATDVLQARGKPALLALETEDGSVALYDTKGNCVSSDRLRSLTTKHQLCRLDWHPHELILACAWSNGAVQLAALSLSGQLQQQRACTGSSECGPTLLNWTPDGNALIVGYTDGKMCIWKNTSTNHASELAWAKVQTLFCTSSVSYMTPSLLVAYLSIAAFGGISSSASLCSMCEGRMLQHGPCFNLISLTQVLTINNVLQLGLARNMNLPEWLWHSSCNGVALV